MAVSLNDRARDFDSRYFGSTPNTAAKRRIRMEIRVLSFSKEQLEARDYSNGIEIYINEKKVFDAFDGEPEDSNLSRDFSDCWGVPDLLKLAYDAGINGEEFIISYGDIED